MSHVNAPISRLEHWLARLLQHGTWVAASTIAIGIAIRIANGIATGIETALSAGGAHSDVHAAAVGTHIVIAGIALFILLPIMRLILMIGMFLHQRDYRFSAIAALVLAIVIAGSLLGAA
jgi:uncharacterized membrane protein